MATLKQKKSQHLDRLVELREHVAQERQQLPELEHGRQDAAREVAARREALVAARARSDWEAKAEAAG